jgi:hypothetical protein
MNELIVKVNQEVGLLNWNFDEINRKLDEYLSIYENLIVSENDVKAAKDIKAELNRIKTQIEDRRKMAKAEFCKPYEDFAAQVKATTAKIDKVTANISEQINAYDAIEKENKRKVIESYWNEICHTEPMIPFEQVMDKKFLNKTTTEKQWKTALDARLQIIMNDLNAISIMEPRKRDFILAKYMNTLDMGVCLNEWEKYVEQLRQAEEFRRQANEKAKATIAQLSAQVKREEESREAAKQPITAPVLNEDEEHSITVRSMPTSPEEPVLHRRLEVWGTRDQIITMGEFMNQAGIKFRKLED